RYGFDLWAQQLVDFSREVIAAEGPVSLQLIGNSIGGVVCLNAARMLSEDGQPPSQVVLIDCAERELDLKRLPEQPIGARLSRPLVMALVRQRWIVSNLFRFFARAGAVRAVLKQAYPSGGNVDDELVQMLLKPSQEAGATESFRGFVNLFDDWLAPQLLERLNVPVRMLWGEADPWEPLEEARRWKQTFACVQDLEVLPGLGHCPHDEAPERVNPILCRWLKLGWEDAQRA
ncbi:MAG: alpha/beta fold hydrolase, partial [Synechococcaceae bacterium WB7_3xG_012]|nr:alpha/beta fold hydrolase [Synechococcaceae bacterium WB7_3xG_012]